MNKYLVASLEAIERQDSNKLFVPLSSYMTRLMGCADDNARSKIILEMEKLIKDKTGINVELLHIDDDSGIWFERMVISINFPYAYRAEKKIMQIYNGKDSALWSTSDLTGDVDLKNGKVRGDFSTVPCKIYFPTKGYGPHTPLSPEERAALVLHEIGHVVGLYEHIGHQAMLSVNQAAVVHAWLGKNTMDRVKVIKRVEADMGVKFDDPQVLADDGSVERVCSVIASAAVKKYRSELGLLHYDATAFETMADTFAVQHGAGKHMVTALDKMHRSFSAYFRESGYRPASVRAFNALALFTATVGAAVASPIIGTFTAGVVATYALGITSFASLMIAFDPKRKDYELPLERYLTIKRNMINTLKSGRQDPTYVKKTLDDLDEVEKVIGTVNSDIGIAGFFDWMGGIINGSSKEIRIRKQYEELANNKLFVSSTKLSQLVNK